MTPPGTRLLGGQARGARSVLRRRLPVGLEPWFARVALAQRAIADAPVADVLAVACAQVRTLLDADAVIVGTREGETVVARAVEGLDTVVVGHAIPISTSLMGLALLTGEPQLCHDGADDQRSDAGVNAAAGIRSSVIVPLMVEGRAVGAVLAGAQRAGAFDDTDLALLDLVASVTAGRFGLSLVTTEQVGMRDALAAHARLLRTVFDALEEGVVLLDSVGGPPVHANPAALRILGLTEAGLRGTSLVDPAWQGWDEDGIRLTPDTWPAAVALRTRTAQRDRVVELVLPGGTRRTLSVTALPVLDPASDGPPSVLVTFTDISDQRNVHEALVESERHLRAAQELTGLAWWEHDPRTGRLQCADRLCEMFGFDPGSPPTIEEFTGLVHPEDREQFYADLGRAQANAAGALSSTFRVVRPDGTVRSLQTWTGQHPAPDGGEGRTFGATLDVTEREQTAQATAEREQQFRLSFDEAPIGMALLDARPDRAGRVLRVNSAFSELIGRTQDEVLHMVPADWTRPDDVEGDLARLSSIYSGAMTSVAYEKRYLHRDGRTVHAYVTAALTRDAEGQPLHVIAHVQDVSGRDAAERALRESQQRLGDAQSLTGLAWWEWDLATDRLDWSPEMYRMASVPPGEPMTAERWHAMHDQDDLRRDAPRRQAAIERGEGYKSVVRIRLAGGPVRYLQGWASAVRGEDGAVRALRGATLDVTARELQAQSMARSEEQFRVAFDNAPIGMKLMSLAPGRTGEILRVNDVFCSMIGHTAQEVLGHGVSLWTHPDDRVRDRLAVDSLIRGERRGLSIEKRYLHREGHIVHAWVHTAVIEDEKGVPRYLISHCLDVTERQAQEQELHRLALSDTLTGLANRTLFEAELRRALEALRIAPATTALLLLDIDRFKLVNDTLGHQVGDALLVEVGHRLVAASREGTVVARLGGDEFVLLVTGVDEPEEVAVVARRALETVREPFELPSGDVVVVSASLGIATTDDPSASADELFREADLALYQAKDEGRDRIAVFGADLRSRAVARRDVEAKLRRALAESGLQLALQPVVALPDGRPTQAEALVRLLDPEVGMVSPLEFIEVAEESGLIVGVDTWVLERAVTLLADPACSYQRIAINVSGRTLASPGLVERVADALRRCGVAPGRLMVELTESTLLESSSPVIETIRALRTVGCPVGIDDFGTGYSALSYLQRFELDFLKIDRSFISPLDEGPQPVAVVKAIVDLAHALDLRVTAEGVETQTQADILSAMGCDHAQGWLFGRPTIG